MIPHIDRFRFGAYLLGVLVGACGSATTGEVPVPVDDHPAAVMLPNAADESDVGAVVDTVASVRLLTEVIPPCVPLVGVDHVPCPSDVAPSVEHPSTPGHGIPSYVKNPPSFEDIMAGVGVSAWATHIVVRVTVEPDTTRCDGYLDRRFPNLGGFSSSHRHYWCFADVRVNEYIVGEGPTTLTIGLHYETFFEFRGHTWEEDREFVIEREFENPDVRTAAVYEGRELVLFLAPTDTMTVEAWAVGGHWDTWFVLRDGANVTAAWREGDRVVSEVNLDDLVTSVKAAAATRTVPTPTTVAGSSSTAGSSPTTAAGSTSTTLAWGSAPPFLVTRADRLRDFYVASGAVYVGEDATTVLPPPPPEAPGVPTNVGMSVEDGVVLVRWDEPESGGDVVEYRVWLLSDLADGGTKSFYNVASYQGEWFFEITYMVGLFGDEFSVQVRAGNRVGFSPWTEKRFFTTPSSSSG